MNSTLHNKSSTRSRAPERSIAEQLNELELLRSVFDSFKTGVVVLDRDLRYLMVNEAAAELNGLAIADHIGRRAVDLLPAAFPLVEPYYREVFRTGKSIRQPPFQTETPAMPAAMRWWDVRYHPLVDPTGSVIAVTAVFVDASEKVAAESRLAYTLHELRSVLDVVPVGLAIAHDTDCKDVELNDAYRRIHHMPADMTFKQWREEAFRHNFTYNGGEAIPADLPLWKAATTGQPTEAGRIDITFTDKASVSILARAAPLIIDGRTQGAVAAYVDITDLVQIQEKLQTANSVQYDFLAMVSHELRTPMTMILGNAQLLSRANGSFAEDERRSLATDIYSEAVSLSHIVDNLLLMTRIDRGEKLEMEPMVLRHICSKVIQDLPLDAASRCRCAFPNGVAVVAANPSSVEQVIRNLLSNALKYSPETEMVDLSLEVQGNDVVFGVADRGPGVLAGDRERIFEPFFRAESSATRSGMGIGLAVCRRLLELMEGRIWSDARDGGGSVFCFSLPSIDTSPI